MSTYLTADTHFGHSSIIKNCGRPFADVDEHDEALVERWNDVVHPRDTVWHLGDFAVGLDEGRLRAVFGALKGNKKLVLGNHDVDNKGRLKRGLARLPWAAEPTHYAEVKHAGRRVVLSHYAHLSWSAQHYGTLHAYGHSHGKLAALPGCVDVGVDAQDYAPVSVEDFVRQADLTLLDAEDRVERLVAALRRRVPAMQAQVEKRRAA